MGEAQTIETVRIVLKHADGEPAARIENGCLVLRSRRDRTRETSWTLADILRWVEMSDGGR